MSEDVPRQDLTHIQILALALYSLGGDARSVDTEEIAIRANELAPGRFSWRLYPERISLESVRRNLAHAKKPSNGSMIEGSASRGWHLTAEGLSWSVANSHALERITAGRKVHDKEANRRRRLNEARMADLDALRKYRAGEPVATKDAEAVFRLSEYVTEERRRLLIDRTLALFTDDEELADFVRAMAEIVERDLEGTTGNG